MSICKINYVETDKGEASIKIVGNTDNVIAGLLLTINQFAKEKDISVEEVLTILQDINDLYEKEHGLPTDYKFN